MRDLIARGCTDFRDPEMPLWRAHDLSQDLQDQIEALPDVDRCFVHVDHEVDHKPEHRKKA